MGRARYGVREEIKEAVEGFYRAVSTKNLKAIGNLWAHEPYATVAGRSGHLYQGWENVLSYWQRRFAARGDVALNVKLQGMVCHAIGDVAWVSGIERRYVTENGEKREEELRMTAVMERRPSGWQIVSYHVSLPTAESPALANAS